MDLKSPPLLKKGDYVYGSFVKASHTSGFINDNNPGDRSDQIGRYPFSLQNTKEAILYAKEAQPAWSGSTIRKRMAVVNQFQEQLETHNKALAITLTRETGIPLWEAKQEVAMAHQYMDKLIAAANTIFQNDETPSSDVERQFQSLGTVALLTPFSQPLLTSCWFSAAALLMGNCVVYKPSKYTPGVGQAIAELWDRCRLPRGSFNMVQGPGSHIGQYILSHPMVNGSLFAGSYPTATEILHNKPPAPHHKFMGFFGGKSAAIVLDSADLTHTARELLASSVRYTGQRPTTIARVFITKGMSDVLIDTLAESLDQIKVGFGAEKDSYLGPMISEHWRTRYHRYGHTLYTNKHTPIRNVENLDNDMRGYYVRPALYKVNWDSGSTMLDDTPPGPILLVYEVKNYAEAVELYNQLNFRKYISVFGSVEELKQVELETLSCGGLFLNQAPEDSILPTGGMGFNSNIPNGGTDILQHLIQKKFIFGMDALNDGMPTEEEEEVAPDPSKIVTLIEDVESSDEDYGDW